MQQGVDAHVYMILEGSNAQGDNAVGLRIIRADLGQARPSGRAMLMHWRVTRGDQQHDGGKETDLHVDLCRLC